MNRKRVLGVEIPSDPPPPGATLSEHEYRILAQQDERLREVTAEIAHQGERIDQLELSSRVHGELLARIDAKLDKLTTKDSLLDIEIERINEAVAAKAGEKAGNDAAISVLKKAGPWGAAVVLVVSTADKWLPALLAAVSR